MSNIKNEMRNKRKVRFSTSTIMDDENSNTNVSNDRNTSGGSNTPTLNLEDPGLLLRMEQLEKENELRLNELFTPPTFKTPPPFYPVGELKEMKPLLRETSEIKRKQNLNWDVERRNQLGLPSSHV